MEEQVAVIYACMNCYLDALPVNRVRAFDDGLLSILRRRHADLLDSIRTSRDLSADSEAKLKAAVEAFAKSFS